MRKEILLQNYLNDTLSFMHKARKDVLFGAVDALLEGASLALTDLGRKFKGKAKERHQIRKMDRLLGNQHLHEEIPKIYAAINRLLLQQIERPIISVDWSCLCYKSKRYLLRASVAIKGRSLVCYQEVRPQADENNEQAHSAFLDKLTLALPAESKPIIVTDAVFSTGWFKKVACLGWDYIGRVRTNRGNYFDIKENHWFPIQYTYEKATGKPSYLGEVLLTHKNKLRCHLIAYKQAHKGRKVKNRKGTPAKGTYNTVCSKASRDPWILATSLPMSGTLAEKVVSFYKTRMQIEEEFRDTKSKRFGFGLSFSGSKIHARVEVLLLINFLASLACWVIACHARNNNQHVNYHANSSKEYNILSAISLGRAVYKKIKYFFINAFDEAFRYLQTIILNGGQFWINS